MGKIYGLPPTHLSNPSDEPPSDDPLDAALQRYAQRCNAIEPPAGLTDAIMARIRDTREGRQQTGSGLREFSRLVATDVGLQQELARSGGGDAFVLVLTQLAAGRGFHVTSGDVQALFRLFEAANDGELNDDQLDAVSAAQGDLNFLWQLFIRH